MIDQFAAVIDQLSGLIDQFLNVAKDNLTERVIALFNAEKVIERFPTRPV